MQGNAPAGDDVTKFLYNFTHDYHPLFVSGAATLIIVVGIILMIKKEVVKKYSVYARVSPEHKVRIVKDM